MIKKTTHRRWTKKEKKFLKENYSTMSNKQLTKFLDRTCFAIQTQAQVMKLKKEYLVKPDSKVIESIKKEKNNDFIIFTLLIGNLIAIIVNVILTIIGG